MLKLLKHFMTVNEHRREVRRGCFRVGLYLQGLTERIGQLFAAITEEHTQDGPGC